MHADVPRAALYLPAQINDFLRLLLGVVYFFELRVFLQGALERHGESLRAEGDFLGDAVADAVGKPERPRHVAHHAAREHRPEGAYLRDVLRAVFVPRVLDHLIATVVGVVHVDVGGRGALGVEEPLKRQFVLERVYIGNSRHVGNKRAGDRAADSGEYFILPRKGKQVGNHQEVRRVAFVGDNVELVLDALTHLWCCGDKSFLDAFFYQPA